MEYGLYSDDTFAKLSEQFVCVRTYVGVPGADEMLKRYGIVGTRGRGPWVQGNNIDYVFLTPDLTPLTHDGLKETTPEPTADSQNSIRWVYTVPGARGQKTTASVATAAMKKVLALYPPKDAETIRVPWQLNASTAVHFASYEDRRIVLVPAGGRGEVNPKLAAALGDAAVLRKHVHNYVFLKVTADEPVPAELREAMKRAGDDGLVIAEKPDGLPAKGAAWQSVKVRATSPAPLAAAADVLRLLDEHERPPGWDADRVPGR